MSDSSERGGSMQSFYHQEKSKDGVAHRINKEEVLKAVLKASKFKGDGRNKPMANVMGPEKGVPKGKGY